MSYPPRPWTIARLMDRSEQEPNTGCWLWTGTVNEWGYGQAWHNGCRIRAHRLAYLIVHGGLPPDGQVVMHICDNPPCVNPDHLRAGTRSDNQRDMVAKGRDGASWFYRTTEGRRLNSDRARGSNNHRSKLTEQVVRALRADHAAGASPKELAARYNTPLATVYAVTARATWKWLE